jgi:hypothetical protein
MKNILLPLIIGLLFLAAGAGGSYLMWTKRQEMTLLKNAGIETSGVITEKNKYGDTSNSSSRYSKSTDYKITYQFNNSEGITYKRVPLLTPFLRLESRTFPIGNRG